MPEDEIALAGHGYDELGAGLHDDAAGDGSPGGDGDLHAVGVPQVEYVLERAGPAAGAVVDVVGEAVGAAARLDAVGQEHEKLARLALDAAAEDQLVVDLDEGTAHGGYGDAHHPAHELHDRQEQADSDAAQARCAEYGLSGVGVEHQPHGKPKDSEDGPAEDDARDEREPRMDGREPDGRDKPDEQKQHAEQDGRADHQTDEQPLAGTFVFILGQGKCGLGDAHLGFARMR